MDPLEENRRRKYIDKKTAFLKAQQYCVYQERSQQEVRNKLYEWGLYKDDVENIIVELIESKFINEERFALAYASGKFRIKKWGKVKIKAGLKSFNISIYCINKALSSINSKEYSETLKDEILKKAKVINERNILTKKLKIINYMISRGFERDLINDILDECLIK